MTMRKVDMEKRAAEIEAREKEWMERSAKAVSTLTEQEKQLRELMDEIAKNKRTITRAREYIRKQKGLQAYKEICMVMRMEDEVAVCTTESDFETFNNKLINRIRELLNIEASVPMVKELSGEVAGKDNGNQSVLVLNGTDMDSNNTLSTNEDDGGASQKNSLYKGTITKSTYRPNYSEHRQ